MSITKEQIIQSATRLFKEKGFLVTSVQDIADDCQIAKGSVYKFFPSKEDLFSEVFEQCQNNFFQQLEQLYFQSGFTGRDRFLKQVIFRYQYSMEYKLILVEFTELPLQQDIKFSALRIRERGRLMEWHKQCLLDLYGPEIEPYLWDLVFIYKAIVKEYLLWVIDEQKPLPLEETALFVVEKLDVLVENFRQAQSKTLLTENFFEYHIRGGFTDQTKKPQLLAELLEKTSQTLAELPVGNLQRHELSEALNLLKAELEKTSPQNVLLQALLAYLEREPGLKSLVLQLKNIVR